MAVQQRYDELFKLLSGDFRRNYAPHHAFADACSMFLTLPGLVGFWPGSAVGTAGLLNDLSGNGLQMNNNNGVLFSAETSSLIPWLEFDGVNQYFSRADEAILDISGTEAYVATPIQGITLGGWFWFDAIGVTYGLMSKFVTGGQASYRMRRDSNNRVFFLVSSDGTNEVGTSSVDAPNTTAGAWFFCVGRAINGTTITVFLNGIENEGGAAPPAPIFNSTSDFEIGRMNAGSYLNGRASMCFLCAAAVPTVHLTTLYQWTRPMFNR